MIEELLTLSEQVARAAGAFVRDAGTPTNVTNKSSRSDMVTEVDKATELLIRELILAARPDDSIIGEEGDDLNGSSEVQWIVDPIDGTTNFVYGIPCYAVSIAVRIAGVTSAATVFDIPNQEIFTAALGQGSKCNGKSIAVSQTANLSDALIGTGFSYDPDRRIRQSLTLSRIVSRIRDVRRAGAASVDLCWVACGRLDGFYEQALFPWDFAAAELIVKEAGGVVGNTSGIGASRTMTIAANSNIFNELQSMLKDGLEFDEAADNLD